MQVYVRLVECTLQNTHNQCFIGMYGQYVYARFGTCLGSFFKQILAVLLFAEEGTLVLGIDILPYSTTLHELVLKLM